METIRKATSTLMALAATLLLTTALLQRAEAQDQYDPPTRVARIGYIQGAVSFQPAGESEWVDAVPNRPMTTGDRIWADRDSRAELQIGPALIDLNSNTGLSFLNLDDRTTQVEVTSGAVNVRVRHLNRDDVFEIDTPNQAFSIYQPGRYRVEASEDGTYTVVSVREGGGESTGNGQTYTVRAGQRATFEGTNSLNAQIEEVGGPDDFDNWSYRRYNRYDDARSGRYVSRDMVGYEDLDDNGDWRPYGNYGNVWFPHVAAGWAPYREGHWAWIDPWGWTWVDDEPWGYAPFHYGRWCFVEGRWGWIPGPMEVTPVYAPALVAFVGGGPGGFAFGADIAWFPLGPGEVYVPAYQVSQGYFSRVNVSNTTVNTTTITNVYNTTIVNKSTTITSVNYVNRNVSGAVTAVPKQAFVSAQPVAQAAVRVDPKQLASVPVAPRAAVVPTTNSVLGTRAATAKRAPTPPAAVVNRPVIAKATPPPPPFAARQQVIAQHPGQPVARQEMQRLQPATSAAARPLVKQAPPGKPATATPVQPGSQPGNRPGNPPAMNNRPGANPAQPNNRPEANRPPANGPEPNNRPEANRPEPGNRPEANRPQANPPEPNNRPEAKRPEPGNRPKENRPQANRPDINRPETDRPEPPARNEPPTARPNNRPETKEPPQRSEPAARPENSQRPAPGAGERPSPKAQQHQQKQEDKKREDKKREEQSKPEERPPS